jgi:malonyl-CoA O-methyltransferase
MQFFPEAIENKMRHIDQIQARPDLIDRIVKGQLGPDATWSAVPRVWEPGGGSSLFLLAAGGQSFWLKVKHRTCWVESRLESEPDWTRIPSLEHESHMLNELAGPVVPAVRFYTEQEDFTFLAVEKLQPFSQFAAAARCDDLLRVWKELLILVRGLFERGIVHTDIHENNLCMRGDSIVLVDFEEAKHLTQDVPFEASLDYVGENRYGNVGEFPKGHSEVEGLTCLARLRLVFKRLLADKLPEQLAQCNFDQDCPFNLDALQQPDARIYQSVSVAGVTVSGHRHLTDSRLALVRTLLQQLPDRAEGIRYVDLGCNLGVFCFMAARLPQVALAVGLEAFAPYVSAARTIAFLDDLDSQCRAEQFICGEDDLQAATGPIHVLSMLSMYHHVANKEQCLDEIRRVNPDWILGEFAAEDRFYPERGSLQAELQHMQAALGYAHCEFIAQSRDYHRPVYVFSHQPLPARLKQRLQLAIVPRSLIGRCIPEPLRPAAKRWARRLRNPGRTLRNAARHYRSLLLPPATRPDPVPLPVRFERAMQWLRHNTLPQAGVRVTHDADVAYPEVTGYLIPSLIEWGEHDLARDWAQWLLAIQRPDGAWNGPSCDQAYTFDTGQILKGLLAIQPRLPQVEPAIRAACDWLLTQVQPDGSMTTPDKSHWRLPNGRVIPEAIHLYCLAPWIEAGKRLDRPDWIAAARRVHAFYSADPAWLHFDTLAHFHAYIAEALCDLNDLESARSAMQPVLKRLKPSGHLPAYADCRWTCSPALFQYAVTLYKLGEFEPAQRIFNYAAQLQNETGGFFGSHGRGAHYFPAQEISWAVKYMLDALAWKIRSSFDATAFKFPDAIEADDARLKLVLDEFARARPARAIDFGCGHGRFLRRLQQAAPQTAFFGLDVSQAMLEHLPAGVTPVRSGLLDIPFPDGSFDFGFCVEALEHAVAIEQALREMLRVIAPGGTLLIIDKNQQRQGALAIEAWEKWFDLGHVQRSLEQFGCIVQSIADIGFEPGRADCPLFVAWIARKPA